MIANDCSDMLAAVARLAAGGGSQVLPRSWKGIKYALKVAMDHQSIAVFRGGERFGHAFTSDPSLYFLHSICECFLMRLFMCMCMCMTPGTCT
jgi:hypothetical protein